MISRARSLWGRDEIYPDLSTMWFFRSRQSPEWCLSAPLVELVCCCRSADALNSIWILRPTLGRKKQKEERVRSVVDIFFESCFWWLPMNSLYCPSPSNVAVKLTPLVVTIPQFTCGGGHHWIVQLTLLDNFRSSKNSPWPVGAVGIRNNHPK